MASRNVFQGWLAALFASYAGAAAAQSSLSCTESGITGEIANPTLSAALSELAQCVDATIEVKGELKEEAINITLHDSTFDQAVSRIVRDTNYVLRKTQGENGTNYTLSFPVAAVGSTAPANEESLPQPSAGTEAFEPPEEYLEEEEQVESGEQLEDIIETALRAPDVDARFEAIERLAEIGGRDAGTVLEELLYDSDEEVQEYVRRILNRLEH